MRSLALMALAILMVAGFSGAEDVDDPERTNVILTRFSVLQLYPGQSGSYTFEVNNPYTWEISNLSLLVEIYAFRLPDAVGAIEDVERPPFFRESQLPASLVSSSVLQPDSSWAIELTVETLPETPSGGFFQQGTYFVRFRLEFDYLAGLHAVMVSPGHFTSEEFEYALRTPTSEERGIYRFVGNANYTYLGQVLGLESIDGLLPDGAFGVKQPLPVWPFYLVLGSSVGALLIGIYYLRKERQTDAKAISRGPR